MLSASWCCCCGSRCARCPGLGTIINAIVVGLSADATLARCSTARRDWPRRVALTARRRRPVRAGLRALHRRPARPRPARRTDDRPRPPHRALAAPGPHRPRGRSWSSSASCSVASLGLGTVAYALAHRPADPADAPVAHRRGGWRPRWLKWRPGGGMAIPVAVRSPFLPPRVAISTSAGGRSAAGGDEGGGVGGHHHLDGGEALVGEPLLAQGVDAAVEDRRPLLAGREVVEDDDAARARRGRRRRRRRTAEGSPESR